MTKKLRGNIVDIEKKTVFFGEVEFDEKIISITKTGEQQAGSPFMIPGFIDAHVHIESSMLIPSEFARLAVVHGTVGTISDPHEIANVCGMKGVEYMIKNGKTVPFKFHFGAPSCVPATSFETAGAELNAEAVDLLLANEDIYYLSEMMNFPGVLQEDSEVLRKLSSAKKYGKPVDGHAPGLMGGEARKYAAAGISTDHECFTADEAIDKLKCGMKILIREGSAAKNFDALIDLLHEHEDEMMFCSDDKHPDSLVSGHINILCKRAVQRGIDVFKVLKAACINPVKHYKMRVGQLQKGDDADFAVIGNLENFEVIATYINGLKVAESGESKIDRVIAPAINEFHCSIKTPEDFQLHSTGFKAEIIEAIDEQLITNKLTARPKEENGFLVSDAEKGILKLAVVNRYKEAPPAIAFIKNFGLKNGAIASSVAHDSHNIIVVGVNDESITAAVNLIIKEKGGISTADVHDEQFNKVLPLPVAGLMSNEDGYKVARQYHEMDRLSKEMGSTLNSPFMTLSFMALLVIPHLKLSDKGLFDGDSFKLL